MNDRPNELLIKVPVVTLGFWIIKILATTVRTPRLEPTRDPQAGG